MGRVGALFGARTATDEWQTRLFQALSETGVAASSVYWHRIEIRSVGKTEFVSMEDVFWLKADGNYIEVHTAEKVHLARITMSDLEKHLDPRCFLRVSRSSLVNLRFVRGIQSVGYRGHVVVLEDGSRVAARRSIDQRQAWMKYLPQNEMVVPGHSSRVGVVVTTLDF
ncbi:MAG: LytTR family DNA-binding domain-containing protein [Verrucomicrobia bacterium]|nr:LytTR family DNA-binding domain-containing protein [Verrucomicrobiota bacterium]